MNKATSFRPEDIRNVVLLGHGGTGKTTLAEAILHRCGAISRMGSVSEGNTTGDFEPEAKEHQHSTNSALLFATYERREVNIIDTPGHPEFIGYALSALPAVETAIIVVSATTGIEFNTRRLFHAAGEAGLARMIVVNKIDGVSPAVLRGRVDELKEAFGSHLHCMNLPTRGGKDVIDCFDQEAGAADFLSVKDVHAEMLESTIEIDDAKLERYLGGEKLDLGELRQTFVKAMAKGHVVPIVFTSAREEVGVDDLLHILVEEAPSPVNGRKRRMLKDGELVEVACDAEAPFMAHVFKVTNDPGVGQLAMLRVLQGKLDGGTSFVCGTDKKVRKAGHVLKVEGRDHPEFDAVAYAGDLVALARVEDLHVDQVLHDPALEGDWQAVPVKYPAPMLSLAVESKNRGDDVKLAQSLSRLAEEDPTFKFHHDTVTHELVLSGVGDVHLRILLERLKNRFKLDVTTKAPTVPYRETITTRAEGHYRHKKQTGGAGQFAEVFLRIEPLPRGSGFEFKSEVFGGSIPTNFIPAVEKGVVDALEAGNLAGFPVHDVRVVVYDGKHHPVDSKDIAFRTAGKMATRDAIAKARPVLLEPVVNLEVSVPEQYMGAITGDLKHVRGRVMGIETLPGGYSMVRAQAPLAELGNYGGQLRGITGGTGSYVMELSHYEPVPPMQQQKIIEARPARKAEAE
ncbi:MAG: elongation factor G [Myxococcota bacterium]